MKRKDIIEGKVERMDFPNIGIIPTKEGNVRVKLALPGQTVRVRIQKKKKNQITGQLLEVINASPLETSPNCCPSFGQCGGCLYGAIPYETQLQIKHEQVIRLLQPVLGDDLLASIDEGVVVSPVATGYRNKMEFTFGDSEKDGPLALGMHKRGSFYDIVTVDQCRLVDEDFRKILRTTLSYFTDHKTSFFHRRTHEGYLRHLLVRKATKTGEILVDLVSSTQMPKEKEKERLSGWKDALMRESYEGQLTGILHTKNDRIADIIEDQGTTVLYGQDTFCEHLLGLQFTITPFSFFQTNSLGAEVLYETVREFLPDTKGTLYDLYAGTGTIAQILAPVMEQCIGVEIVEEAVAAARENAKKNHLTNCTFFAGDVLHVLDTITTPPDTIVLDPPRDGVHPKALPKILSYGVKHIVYISCKASSLARDIPVFIEAGYRPIRLKVVDLFPFTGNVETLLLFSKEM